MLPESAAGFLVVVVAGRFVVVGRLVVVLEEVVVMGVVAAGHHVWAVLGVVVDGFQLGHVVDVWSWWWWS